jgi:hypothetical protein
MISISLLITIWNSWMRCMQWVDFSAWFPNQRFRLFGYTLRSSISFRFPTEVQLARIAVRPRVQWLHVDVNQPRLVPLTHTNCRACCFPLVCSYVSASFRIYYFSLFSTVTSSRLTAGGCAQRGWPVFWPVANPHSGSNNVELGHRAKMREPSPRNMCSNRTMMGVCLAFQASF